MTPITLTATLEDPTPNATGLVKVRFERPEGIVFAWVPPGAILRPASMIRKVVRFGKTTEDGA